MIDRQSQGVLPDKPHTQLRAPNGEIVYEEMFTRAGFSGAFSYFYHRFPTTSAESKTTTRGHAVAYRSPSPVTSERAAQSIRRRLYLSDRVATGKKPLDARVPVLFNKDLTVFLARATETDDTYFSNGDADELWYVHEGKAKLESPCGWLDVGEGDYVWVPRSLIHRWHVESPLRAMVMEGHGGVVVPENFRNPIGQLKMDAPYTHRDFVRPTGPIATWDRVPDGPKELIVKKSGRFSSLALDHSPMDVIGWDGFVYPWAFNILKYQPKTGIVHLPPTIHSTFAGPGFLVCSFVPRLVDYHERAIPCPYPHSSVDCDEVILYLRGNFTSRKGVGPGAISLHPAGIAHGPHPGAYEKSIGTTRTDELAVMIDTYDPLVPTSHADALEDPGYHDSWRA
jgi:homogentisate 1,2-dioxygenase